MNNSKQPFDDGQLFEYSQLIEGLAAITSFKNSSYSTYSEVKEKLSKQEVEDIFDILLERVITAPQVDNLTTSLNSTQVSSSLWEAIAPNIWMKFSLIGLAFFLFAAILTAITNPTAILPIIIYLVICLCFMILFTLLWAIKWVEPFKNPLLETIKDFDKAKNEAILFELQIVDAIVEKASSRQELQYIKNKLQIEIDLCQDKMKLAYKFLRIGMIFVVALIIYNFVPFQVLISTIFSENVAALSAILSLISVVGAGIVLMLEFILDSMRQFKISRYKTCLYLLQQAQLLKTAMSD